ncbi:permease-like cell division protein FtsX, partial [Calderihabitans maritimus]
LGLFLLILLNTNYAAKVIESSLEIVVFVEVNTPQEAVEELGEELSQMYNVAEVRFIPKEEGLMFLNRQLGEEHDLLKALAGRNPLPDVYIVKAREPRNVPALANAIEQMSFVEKVKYGKGVVEKLFAVISWLRWIGTLILILLSVGAIFLIAICVRLTVYTRRKEINIMKYVGASDWFIRWPFFLEGMILGFLGSLLAGSSMYFTYDALVRRVKETVPFVPVLEDPVLLWQVVGLLALAGTLMGALASAISVRRFLRV